MNDYDPATTLVEVALLHQVADGLDRLKTASQNANRKLRDVAADVLYTGQLSTPRPSAMTPPNG